MRLFVAVNLPADEKRRLGDALQSLTSPSLPVRWVSHDGLHITLKFLGEVPDGEVPAVRGALRRASNAVPSFDVAIFGFSAFPSHSRPRIFWVGASLSPELGQLQTAIDSEFENIGYSSEHRPFTPHVTVGRLKKDASIRDRGMMDRIAASFEYKSEFRVHSADLMRSHSGPRGAHYEVIEKVELN